MGVVFNSRDNIYLYLPDCGIKIKIMCIFLRNVSYFVKNVTGKFISLFDIEVTQLPPCDGACRLEN